MERDEKGEPVFPGKRIPTDVYSDNLWTEMKKRMLSYGDRVALIDPYKQEELSYDRVVSLAERLSRGLYKLGLRQGTTLCFLAPNSVEIALIILATHATGGIVHGTNPASMPGELRRHLELTEAKIIVTTPELLPVVTEATDGMNVELIVIGPREGHINYTDLLTLGSEDVTVTLTPADPKETIACFLFSSGTTGLPKAVEMTQTNIVSWFYIWPALDGPALGQDDSVVHHLPFFHAYGQNITMMTCLAFGCRLVVMGKFDLTDFLTFLTRYKATAFFTVPPVVLGMLNHPRLSDFDLSSLHFVSCGAAPLGKETHAQFTQKIGLPCLQGYGMTENLVGTFSSPLHHRVGSCGRPLPNMEFKIVHPDTGRYLGQNETGELCMRGPMTMRGYYKNPQATRDTIDSQGWLHSGDIARFDSDGYMYVVDRRKELIKYKGEQVPPAMLEDVLLGHPAVTDACVIGRSDTVAGELPMAFVVKATGSDLTEQEVKDFVAKNVPSYMQLRGGVEFRQQIPKSPSGKILRRLLREELKQQLQAKL